MSVDRTGNAGSKWNYRIMRHEEAGVVTYTVHKVFYDGEKVTDWDMGVPVKADNRSGILRELVHMVQACRLAVLDFSTGLEVEPEIDIAGEIHEATPTLYRSAGG